MEPQKATSKLLSALTAISKMDPHVLIRLRLPSNKTMRRARVALPKRKETPKPQLMRACLLKNLSLLSKKQKKLAELLLKLRLERLKL